MMKFIITVDTEADNQWKQDNKISLNNIDFLDRFQLLCEKYNFYPTYLVSYEVANNEKAVSILKKYLDNKKAEIGAHLHPWSTPPFNDNDKEQAFPNELSNEELKNKLNNLTNKIKESFGIIPLSFRAGRWGFDERLSKYLLEIGYKVDCSITPKISWKNFKGKTNGKGGPDFRSKKVYPVYLKSGLLEVPMTIIYTGFFKENNKISKIFSSMPNSFLKKILNKLFFQLKWCRIFPETSVKDLKKIYQSAEKNDLPVLEFMIHSSELMPNGSPYAKDKKAVEEIYKKLEYFFQYLKNKKVKGIFLKEYEHPRSKKYI